MLTFSMNGNPSLARRLLFALIVAVSGVILVTGGWFYHDALQSESARFEKKTEQISLYLQGALRLPLWDLNDQAVALICQTITEDPLITAIEVRDSRGRVIYALQKPGPDEDSVTRVKSIQYNDMIVGTVEIQASQSEIRSQVKNLLQAIGAVSLAVLLIISLTTVFLIRWFLNQPIEQLNAVAASFGRGPLHKENVLIESFSEFQPLLKILKKMGQQINRQISEIKESEEKFHAIVAGVNDGIFLHDAETGAILMTNPRVSELYGYTSDELRKMTIGELCSGIGSSTQAQAMEWFKWARRGETPTFEWQGKHRNGNLFWTEVSMRQAWIGGVERILISVRDTTLRKLAEEALMKSEERFRALFESAHTMILVLSPEGNILEINPYAQRILNCSRQEVLGKNYIEHYLPEGLRELVRDDMVRMLQGELSLVFESPIISDEKKPREYLWALSRLQDQTGSVYGSLAIGQDITQKQELDRLKSEFIATAAHELNTPLTAVIGFSELLLSENFRNEQERTEYLTIILDKARVLERIIADLLNISRVESGRVIHIEKEIIDLASMIQRVIDAYRKEHPQFKFELNLPAAKMEIVADAHKLEQVMENLLSNALKFSEAGSTIIITGQLTGGIARISVQDHGIGMTLKQKEQCFEKFYRAHASDTSRPGLGLGLCIVKAIIEVHGGQISMESEIGKGTTATFNLPAQGA